jgi:hypothetical protein
VGTSQVNPTPAGHRPQQPMEHRYLPHFRDGETEAKAVKSSAWTTLPVDSKAGSASKPKNLLFGISPGCLSVPRTRQVASPDQELRDREGKAGGTL